MKREEILPLSTAIFLLIGTAALSYMSYADKQPSRAIKTAQIEEPFDALDLSPHPFPDR
jgi:hypothetical protein